MLCKHAHTHTHTHTLAHPHTHALTHIHQHTCTFSTHCDPASPDTRYISLHNLVISALRASISARVYLTLGNTSDRRLCRREMSSITGDSILSSRGLLNSLKHPHLTQAHKNAPQHLEIEQLVTVEDKNEATQLGTQGLHRLCLASTSRTWEERGHMTMVSGQLYTI